MTERNLDVVGIGNAIVDVIAHADDEFLARHELPKGAMVLIDDARADMLYAAMGPGLEVSGGSAANTVAGLAALGRTAGFVGKVRDDQLGAVFAHDLRALGVTYDTPPAADGLATARCLILVTPDAQRTMNTFLGACVELGPEDIDPALIARARLTYLEGYLFDPPRAKAAFRKAVDIAHGAGGQVALTLSDSFCVERHRADFLDLIEHHVDILFANEQEIISLYQAADFDTALQHVRGHCAIAALTRSEKGSVVLSNGEIHVIDAAPISRVLDTTGAGDLYAAGFLSGLSEGRPLHDCGVIGGLAAAEVISHFGARPEASLAELVAAALPVR